MLLGVTFAGISIDEYTVTKPVYKPGEPGVVTISVSNPTGSERVSSITMDINSPYEITVTSSPNLADIDSGGSAIVSIPFKVKDGTRPGILSSRFPRLSAAAAAEGRIWPRRAGLTLIS